MYLVLIGLLCAAAHADPFDFRVNRGEVIGVRSIARPDETALAGLRSVPLIGKRFQIDTNLGVRSSASDTVSLSAARPLTNRPQVVIGGFLKLPLAIDRKSFLDALR